MNTAYRQIYDDFEIAVIKLNSGRFDVQLMPRFSHHSYLIESCESERHAVKGAEKFPIFHKIATVEGFRLEQTGFVHSDGREVHYSYAMDLDLTPDSFKELLNRGRA